MWKLMIIAGAGGFVGTSARYLINYLFLRVWKAPFPLATFTINIVGCLLFGLLFGILQRSGVISPRLNALLIVGFCGGFTTFSTFSAESYNLFNGGNPIMAFSYMGASVFLGIIAVWLGMLLTR